MAKRPYVDIRRKKSRSRKTSKRLAVKHAKAAARRPRRGSRAFQRARR